VDYHIRDLLKKLDKVHVKQNKVNNFFTLLFRCFAEKLRFINIFSGLLGCVDAILVLCNSNSKERHQSVVFIARKQQKISKQKYLLQNSGALNSTYNRKYNQN